MAQVVLCARMLRVKVSLRLEPPEGAFLPVHNKTCVCPDGQFHRDQPASVSIVVDAELTDGASVESLLEETRALVLDRLPVEVAPTYPGWSVTSVTTMLLGAEWAGRGAFLYDGDIEIAL